MIRLPTSVEERSRTDEGGRRTRVDARHQSRGGFARKLLAALAVGAAAYLVVRRLRSLPVVPSADDVRDRAVDVSLEDPWTIPIGEPGEELEAVDAEPSAEEALPDEPGADDRSDEPDVDESPAETGTDEQPAGSGTDELPEDDLLTDEGRSDEEITERAEEEIQEGPAEPGEMAVDEEVVDDLVDEDVEEDEGSDESEQE